MRQLFGLRLLSPLVALALTACGAAPQSGSEAPASATSAATGQKLVVYSGRSESLVAPLFAQFTEATGIAVEARYGDTAELAATILEEGANSPADVFFAQDAGALGALGAADMLSELPTATLDKVEARFRSGNNDWVGVSARARVVVYNTANLNESELPASITAFTDPQWQGRVGWAPTNGSFQSFITAMRSELGDEATLAWVQGMLANEVKMYERNAAIVQAVAAGEIDIGFVNHYYLYQLQRDNGGELAAANYYPQAGDVGALVNIAGLGQLKTAENSAAAQAFFDYMLAEQGQTYFAEQTFEYPLSAGVAADARLKPLAKIQTPEIDLNTLSDLQGSLKLLQDAGAL